MENGINPVKKLNTTFYTSLLLVVVVLVVGFVLLRGTTPPIKESAKEADNAFADINIRPVSQNEHVLGDVNAKVVIVEYSDTECPFCKRFHADMHKLIDGNSDVAWVYRHFPIASLHTKAFNEALATECAAEQGGNDTFWRYTDEVYNRTGSNDSLDPKELYNIAADLDLNILAFRTCLDTKQHTDVVEADMADGSKNKVQGTPTSFVLVNGKVVQVIPGALPYEQLAPFIADLLK
jgi:protein-disulfide isomerase